MDIYEYLKNDHDFFKNYLDKILALGMEDSPVKLELFKELKYQIMIHSKAEEKVLYDELNQSSKEIKEQIEHSKKEHKEVEEKLEQLSDDSLAGAAWFQVLKSLQNSLTHHIQEEENELFPKSKKILPAIRAEEMVVEMEVEKKNLASELSKN